MNTDRDLVRKHLGLDVILPNLEGIFLDDGSINLHKCVIMTKKYPELNDFLEEYLETCEDINKVDHNNFSLLHWAANNSRNDSTFKTVEMLIQADADVFNLKNNFNNAPIDLFSQELLEYCQIDKEAQTIGIKSGKLTKVAKK